MTWCNMKQSGKHHLTPAPSHPRLCCSRSVWFALTLFFLSPVAAGPGRNNMSANFDMTAACDGWQGGFADYPAGQESFYELTAYCADNLTNANRGFFLSGANHSDDLFMFVKHPISDLKQSHTYAVEAEVSFLSRAPTNCVGAGGDPGAGVYIKFGASAADPVPVLQPDGMLRMNVDIGNQSNSGSNAVVIGNIATGNTNCFNGQYELKKSQTPAPLAAQTDENGTLWIFAGADSGFEGRTSLFFSQISVRIRSLEADESQNNDGDTTTNDNHHL